MTISSRMIPTDPSVSEEEDQDLAELIEATIELAVVTFSYPITVLTHLGEVGSPVSR